MELRRFAVILVLLLSYSAVIAQTLPEGFTDEKLNISLDRPIGVEFDQEGFGFIWEKTGKLWLLDTMSNISAQPIIDISEEVASYGDHGLVNIALDPNFKSTGYIYLFYGVDRHYLMNFGTDDYDPNLTVDNQASIGRVTRFTLDRDNNFLVDDDSRKVLLGKTLSDGLPILMISHTTGDLVFGQDGSLLVSSGESASFTVLDKGNANDTYHEQAIADGIMLPEHNVGSYRSMLRNSLLGKILRIDPNTGEGLASNPFFDNGNPDAPISKVWAHGFRNPYKMVKFPSTGSHNINAGDPGVFLVGDVGSGLWEELNKIDEPGQWYGWPLFEGMYGHNGFMVQAVENPEAINPLASDDCDQNFDFHHIFLDDYRDDQDLENPCNDQEIIPGTVPVLKHKRPILSYNNEKWNPPVRTEIASYNDDGAPITFSVIDPENGLGNSNLITGGSIIPATFNVYKNFPMEFDNQLFLVDYVGTIMNASFDDNQNLTDIQSFFEGNKGLTNVSFSPKDGCLYYCNYLDKEIHRICYGGVLPPIAKIAVDKSFGASPLTVNFDASESISNSETPLTYEWDFGDGTSGQGQMVSHTFMSNDPKGRTVVLSVEDQLGKKGSTTVNISINNTPPEAAIASVVDGSTYSLDDYSVVPLRAEVSDQEFDESELSFEWQVDFYHDDHFHPGNVDTTRETFSFIDPLGCGLENYWYKINLKVTDPAGLSATDTVEIFPYCGPDFASFLNLEAEKKEAAVALSWTMSLEEDIDHFEVEKTDNYLFLKIADVNSSDYSFSDNQPFVGRNFYRVRVVNQHGDYSFSETVYVDFFASDKFIVYANPANQEIIIDVVSPEEDDFSISLYSLAGQRILTEEARLGPHLRHTINVDFVPSGVYFYRVTLGDQMYTGRIVVF